MRTVAVALFFLFFGTCMCHAQDYAVEGKITDTHGNALSFVPVYVKGTSNGTIANEQGVYQLKLQPGTYTLIAKDLSVIKIHTPIIPKTAPKITLGLGFLLSKTQNRITNITGPKAENKAE